MTDIKTMYQEATPKRQREIRTATARTNAARSKHLEEVPLDDWPRMGDEKRSWRRVKAWVSRKHLVQEFLHEETGSIRLSVCRSNIRRQDGDWEEIKGWDELFAIKNELYPDRQAVEIYPPRDELVNVANLRHLWILPVPIPVTLQCHD